MKPKRVLKNEFNPLNLKGPHRGFIWIPFQQHLGATAKNARAYMQQNMPREAFIHF
jgi:hypothetical protein